MTPTSGPSPVQPQPQPRKRRLRSKTLSFGVACSPEFRAWLDSFAEAQRTSPTSLVETALVELARARAFQTPPKR